LLYAGGRALFVADAYAKRVLERHGLIPRDASYEFIRQFAETAAAPNVGRLQEFHALLVAVGKAHCRRSAQCRGCPLEHLEDWPPRV
jgi:endonuclease-3 related protein